MRKRSQTSPKTFTRLLDIKKFIEKLQKKDYDIQIMKIKERKLKLSELAREGNIKAIDILNKMDGVYNPKIKIESTKVLKMSMSDFYSDVVKEK